MLLSIIIPCYNAEKYLDNCLKSIYAQNATRDLFEVIAVNDGSTDTTLSILQNWQSAHENLNIIDQSNMGVSAARNHGLEEAKGDYMWFVDSDDYIMPGSLDKIIKLLEKNLPEIICFSQFKRVASDAIYEKESKISALNGQAVPSTFTSANVFNCIYSQPIVGGGTVRKIFKIC